MPLPSSLEEALDSITAIQEQMMCCEKLRKLGTSEEVIYQSLITMAIQYVAFLSDKNKNIPDKLTKEIMFKFYNLCDTIKPIIESYLDEISQCGQNKS